MYVYYSEYNLKKQAIEYVYVSYSSRLHKWSTYQ